MNRRLILIIAMVLLIPTILIGGSGNNNDGDNVLKVGLEAGYAPFNWTQINDANGGVKINGASEYAGGYDVEIAKRIAEGLGKELL